MRRRRRHWLCAVMWHRAQAWRLQHILRRGERHLDGHLLVPLSIHSHRCGSLGCAQSLRGILMILVGGTIGRSSSCSVAVHAQCRGHGVHGEGCALRCAARTAPMDAQYQLGVVNAIIAPRLTWAACKKSVKWELGGSRNGTQYTHTHTYHMAHKERGVWNVEHGAWNMKHGMFFGCLCVCLSWLTFSLYLT